MIRTTLAVALLGVSLSLPAAEPAPTGLMLGAANSGGVVVAVGERGTITRSEDGGGTWNLPTSPATATLTSISFSAVPSAVVGWAAGHDALIIGTTDGGKSWRKSYQGENLQDSFLDVIALDAQRAIAVGAYGLYVATGDGGQTWTRRKLNQDDYHFNRISAGDGGTLYLAGEHGTLLRSTDSGAKWATLKAPYEGSFYGLISPARRVLLVHGLRGHVFRSEDDGKTWNSIVTPEPVLLATAVKLRRGAILIGGQTRALLVSRDNAASFALVPDLLPAGIAQLLELADGNILTVGEAGTTVIAAGRLAAGPAASTPKP